jgi:SAM-dependent methyltransferase
MLEHMYLDEARNVIRRCHRALRPGAVFRVALPNGQAIAARGAEGTLEGALAYNEQLLAHSLSLPSYRQRMVGLFQSPPHRWQPIPALVLHLFHEAGFANPVERKFMESDLPDIERVETRPNSLFVEAVK